MDLAQGALAHASTAAGRKYLQPGFGFTEEDDLLYALGWPSLVWLMPGDAKPAELTDARKFSRTYTYSVGPRPEGVVKRNLRHLVALGHQPEEKKELEAIQNDAPISDEERAGLLDAMLCNSFGFVTTLLHESLTSPRVVLDALADRLAAASKKDWTKGSFEAFAGGSIQAMHFLLLRTDAKHEAESRKRLEGLWDDQVSGYAKEGSRAAQSFDLMLHGKAGVEREGWRRGDVLQDDIRYAPDDLDWVREKALVFIPQMLTRERSSVNARVAFLGGAPVLAAIEKHVKQIHATGRDPLAIGLSRCAHPAVPKIMAGLGTTTAKRWLKAHDGTATPKKPKKK